MLTFSDYIQRDPLWCIFFEAEWRICELIISLITTFDRGLSPVRCKIIIWTNADLLSNGLVKINVNEILFKIQWRQWRQCIGQCLQKRPLCPCLNVLKYDMADNHLNVFNTVQRHVDKNYQFLLTSFYLSISWLPQLFLDDGILNDLNYALIRHFCSMMRRYLPNWRAIG